MGVLRTMLGKPLHLLDHTFFFIMQQRLGKPVIEGLESRVWVWGFGV